MLAGKVDLAVRGLGPLGGGGVGSPRPGLFHKIDPACHHHSFPTY